MGKKKLILRETLQKLFLEDPKACRDALLSLYKRQTEDEQVAHENIVKNGVGFCPCDVKRFTRIAESCSPVLVPITEADHPYLTKPLPGKEYGRLAKYQRQLTEILAL